MSNLIGVSSVEVKSTVGDSEEKNGDKKWYPVSAVTNGGALEGNRTTIFSGWFVVKIELIGKAMSGVTVISSAETFDNLLEHLVGLFWVGFSSVVLGNKFVVLDVELSCGLGAIGINFLKKQK